MRFGEGKEGTGGRTRRGIVSIHSCIHDQVSTNGTMLTEKLRRAE